MSPRTLCRRASSSRRGRSWTADGAVVGSAYTFADAAGKLAKQPNTWVVAAIGTTTNANDTLLLSDPLDMLTNETLTGVTVQTGYFQLLTASAGASPFKQWTLGPTSTLPAGLSLDPAGAGAIYGSPTAAQASASFRVYVVDGAGQRAHSDLSVAVQ